MPKLMDSACACCCRCAGSIPMWSMASASPAPAPARGTQISPRVAPLALPAGLLQLELRSLSSEDAHVWVYLCARAGERGGTALPPAPRGHQSKCQIDRAGLRPGFRPGDSTCKRLRELWKLVKTNKNKRKHHWLTAGWINKTKHANTHTRQQSVISSTDRLALNAPPLRLIAALLTIVAALIWLAIYNSISPTSYYTH